MVYGRARTGRQAADVSSGRSPWMDSRVGSGCLPRDGRLPGLAQSHPLDWLAKQLVERTVAVATHSAQGFQQVVVPLDTQTPESG
uniref:Uncharacterized protein n=1 Tax=Ralstonia solanacearum TaxID=305 RepID=A0A0S4UNQ0_RALSL|nr:protein of unknown function [Ralstonia solanacearum]CUV23841.1 protein of unknown function [Ralstonia solanacearum]CUV30405.1 protein of unknown function [Ralstonia solanacearum]CUV36997.1 protein of unknown function [Ralstonia solanacearum]CUV39930.1 protein of unknown function [Ralstonia solanacearum]